MKRTVTMDCSGGCAFHMRFATHRRNALDLLLYGNALGFRLVRKK